ncbi:MAG: hypothetical protein KGJ13_03850 [Patescibacteria group bacterium]|nr:hypothetical protein [Patescibacteria group bacterium]
MKEQKKLKTKEFQYTLPERDEWEYYYDGMEAVGDRRFKIAKKYFEECLELKPGFIGGYEGLMAIAALTGKKKQEKQFCDLAYAAVRKKFPKWPRRLLWGKMENRPYMRVISHRAAMHHERKEYMEAEELYRLLLKLNPNDNQGVRYLIAGMFSEKMPQQVNDMFDEGNRKQNWDKLENMVTKENAIHKFWKKPK